MKQCNFKKHDILVSQPPHKSPYGKYKDDLERDFSKRCAYCNLHKDSITTPFEVDHFIPKKTFEGIKDDLSEDYKNLVYSCKKCNTAKSSKFHGDLLSTSITNMRFYDPRQVDYNTIFYRNEFGAIDSDDQKGRAMIKDIKLYRQIHILGWLCEELSIISDKLDNVISIEKNSERKDLFQKAKYEILNKYIRYERLFIASYNDSDFSIEGMENIKSVEFIIE